MTSTIAIRELHEHENAQAFADYINALVDEKALISANKAVDLKYEQGWLNGMVRRMHEDAACCWVAECNEMPVAICTLERGIGRLHDNVELGITVSKKFRNRGLGTDMMKQAIKKAKEWKAVNIWLRMVASNTTAQKLYHALGFRPVARMPHWYATESGREDEIIMVLSK